MIGRWVTRRGASCPFSEENRVFGLLYGADSRDIIDALVALVPSSTPLGLMVPAQLMWCGWGWGYENVLCRQPLQSVGSPPLSGFLFERK